MTKVSFVLPAFKARFLKEAIASILAQTYQDFELIVVDDCSPENLKSIVDQFQDERLTYYRNETNLGGKDLVAAWEHALSYAKNDWCVLASDDDVYHPQYLEKMVKLTEKYPQVDLVHARIAVIDAEGRWVKISRGRVECETQVQMAYNLFSQRPLQALPEFMFRRSALISSGGFVKFPLAWGADDATWIRLSRNGVACSQEILFYFRKSGINISTRIDNETCKCKAAACDQLYHWLESYVGEMEIKGEEDVHTQQLLIQEVVPSLRDAAMAYICKLGIADGFQFMRGFGYGWKMFVYFLFEKYPRLSGLKKLIRGK